MNGLRAIFLKVFSHIRRECSSIFVFVLPALLLSIFGYAINLTVKHMPTVVLNLDATQGSRNFLQHSFAHVICTNTTAQALKT